MRADRLTLAHLGARVRVLQGGTTVEGPLYGIRASVSLLEQYTLVAADLEPVPGPKELRLRVGAVEVPGVQPDAEVTVLEGGPAETVVSIDTTVALAEFAREVGTPHVSGHIRVFTQALRAGARPATIAAFAEIFAKGKLDAAAIVELEKAGIDCSAVKR